MKFRDLTDTAEKAGWNVLRAIASIIDRIMSMLFGRSPGLASKVPQLSTKAEDVLQALAAEPTFTKPEVEYLLAHTPTSVLHYYASATAEARATIDLSGLTPEQMDWVFGLSDDDLKKLAQAGPAACEKALAGKKCGVVGLSSPRKSEEQGAPIYKEIAADTPKGRLSDRVRAFKEDIFEPMKFAM